jgi:hypothetical protein
MRSVSVTDTELFMWANSRTAWTDKFLHKAKDRAVYRCVYRNPPRVKKCHKFYTICRTEFWDYRCLRQHKVISRNVGFFVLLCTGDWERRNGGRWLSVVWGLYHFSFHITPLECAAFNTDSHPIGLFITSQCHWEPSNKWCAAGGSTGHKVQFTTHIMYLWTNWFGTKQLAVPGTKLFMFPPLHS